MKDTRLLFSIGSFNVEVGKLITFTICSILLWGTHIILTNGVSGLETKLLSNNNESNWIPFIHRRYVICIRSF